MVYKTVSDGRVYFAQFFDHEPIVLPGPRDTSAALSPSTSAFSSSASTPASSSIPLMPPEQQPPSLHLEIPSQLQPRFSIPFLASGAASADYELRRKGNLRLRVGYFAIFVVFGFTVHVMCVLFPSSFSYLLALCILCSLTPFSLLSFNSCFSLLFPFAESPSHQSPNHCAT